ncbi:MAG TPA: hypothetical protein VG798_00815 [Rhizomicrobium sp.]|nr:hypothetical protein [Rhizomicrobium sp.]
MAHAQSPNGTAQAEQTSARFAVVQDYIRELAVAHQISEDSKARMAESKAGGGPAVASMSDNANFMARKVQSLETSANLLKPINLGPPDQRMLQGLQQLYEQDESAYQEMAGMFDFFSKNPGKNPPNIGKFDQDMRVILQIDHGMWGAAPILFSFLVDMGAAAAPHKGRLRISKAQRQELIDQTDQAFGPNPDPADPTGVSGAAIILKNGLKGDFLASDE